MRPRDLKVAGVATASSCGSGGGLEVEASSGDGILGCELEVEDEKGEGRDGEGKGCICMGASTFSRRGRLLLNHAARVPAGLLSEDTAVSSLNRLFW